MDRVKHHLQRALEVEERQFKQLLDTAVSVSRDSSRFLRPLTDKEVAKWGTGYPLTSPRSAKMISLMERFTYQPADLPREISLVAKLRPIKNQGERGTCVAFGTIAMREFLANNAVSLSEQYLYWGAKKRDGQPNQPGTIIKYAIHCLLEEGVCEEVDWPYNPKQTNDEAQGPPPARALKNAAKYRISQAIEVDSNSVDQLKRYIFGGLRGEPTVLTSAILVFDSWYRNRVVAETGDICLPIPGELPISGHCIALVGYRDDADYEGGGYFIIRNSWGTSWAPACPDGAGYGRVPYAFMANYGLETYSASVQYMNIRLNYNV